MNINLERIAIEWAEVFDWAESDDDFDCAAEFLVECNPGLKATKIASDEIYVFSVEGV